MAEYIEREALRRAVFDAEWLNSQDEDVAYDVLESVPAADVAPVVHGRWFDTGVENETGNIYFCSACDKFHNPNKKDVAMKRAKEKPSFCPNCGADMRGE